MNKYWQKIEKLLREHPGEYMKIDEIRVRLLAPRRLGITEFDRAWKDLVTGGRVEISGNSIRINQ